MDLQRSFFIFGFFFILFLVLEIWNFNTNAHIHVSLYQNHNVNLVKNDDVNSISVTTNVLHVKINLEGGDIEQAQLLHFKDKLNSSKPLILLDNKKNFIYKTKSGVIRKNFLDNENAKKKPIYIASKKHFKLKKNQKEIHIPLLWTSREGITYIKTFIFKSNSYDIDVKYKIYNKTNKNLEISFFGGLQQSIGILDKKDASNSNFSLQTFRGAAYSTDSVKYEKYHFDAIFKQNNLNVVTYNGWIAMLQQYFVTAWIPDNILLNTFYTAKVSSDVIEIGFYSHTINVKPHSQITYSSKLWIGPEIQNAMAQSAPNLDLTVDYGYLWFLSQPLFKLLKFLYNIVGNWGVSIILITFIIRGIMYPLTKSQYTTMTKIKKIQPKIDQIKQNYENNKQKMSEKILELYKFEKVNPLGGCFPLLIQMPIFLALYYMLISSVELRHAPFVFWIKDLSDQDPYYVLPVLMGLTMFLIQIITPNNISDPVQRKVMHVVPMIFTVFFLWFPSGLVIYYITSNLVTIIQQKYILNHLKDTSEST
ncbi:MAG: membrane protein insertase YidC [Buchnera aphidicola (Kaburagia rhusicola rhusicola)]